MAGCSKGARSRSDRRLSPDVVRAAVEESGRRLAAACWSAVDGRPRAVAVDELSRALFETDEPNADAIRGLLLVRGLGDAFSRWFSEEAKASPIAAPSFRLHTFFRSIEGLYAPLDRGASSDDGVPTVQSERWAAFRLSGRRALVCRRNRPRSARLRCGLLEILYCECCGEIFVGGMRRRRGTNEFELLPTEAELDGLPDSAASQRFEDLSFDQYCLFWPTDRTDQPPVADRATRVLGCGPTGSGDCRRARARTYRNGPSGQHPRVALYESDETGPAQANESGPRDECAVRMSRMRDGLLSASDR